MQRKVKRIGISGGTFDPIHLGHLIIAEELREMFKLDKIVFIPTGLPPHKGMSTVSEPEHRYNMVLRATQTNKNFEISHIEMERQGYTYTIDTLMQLKQIYGEQANLFFITGADVIKDLLTWKQYKELFTLCEFIAAMRPGYVKEHIVREIEYLRATYMATIHVADVPIIGISSTMIRERVKNGKSIKYLVPDCVEHYIIENRLYL